MGCSDSSGILPSSVKIVVLPLLTPFLRDTVHELEGLIFIYVQSGSLCPDGNFTSLTTCLVPMRMVSKTATNKMRNIEYLIAILTSRCRDPVMKSWIMHISGLCRSWPTMLDIYVHEFEMCDVQVFSFLHFFGSIHILLRSVPCIMGNLELPPSSDWLKSLELSSLGMKTGTAFYHSNAICYCFQSVLIRVHKSFSTMR